MLCSGMTFYKRDGQTLKTMPLVFFLCRKKSSLSNQVSLCTTRRGHREGGPTGFSKKSKTPFFRDIEKSYQEVTPIGPEPDQFFSF